MHVLPFYFLLCFYFTRSIDLNATFLCNLVRLSGSSDPITLIYSSCVYYLYMDTTAISRWFLMPFLAIICVNVTSTTSLCMVCIIYFSSTQCWWWIGCHMFSLQTYFRFVQPLFFCWTFMSLCPCFHAPQFPFLLLLFSFLITMFLSLLVASCLHLQSFFCVIIFNGGIFLVSLVLIFEDVVTWVISPLWWVIIFICLSSLIFPPSTFSVISSSF